MPPSLLDRVRESTLLSPSSSFVEHVVPNGGDDDDDEDDLRLLPSARVLEKDSDRDRRCYSSSSRRRRRRLRLRRRCAACLAASLCALGLSCHVQRGTTFLTLDEPLVDAARAVRRLGLFRVEACVVAVDRKTKEEDNQHDDNGGNATHWWEMEEEDNVFRRRDDDDNQINNDGSSLVAPVVVDLRPSFVADDEIGPTQTRSETSDDDRAVLLNRAQYLFSSPSASCVGLLVEDDVGDDSLWRLARVFGSAALYVGALSTMALAMLALTVAADGDDRRRAAAVGAGFLVAYVSQILIFLLFDSKLCAAHGCHVGGGAAAGLVAGATWLGVGLTLLAVDATPRRRWSGRKRRARERARYVRLREDEEEEDGRKRRRRARDAEQGTLYEL